MTDAAVLAAMVRVEQAWLDALVDSGIAPKALVLEGLVGPADVEALAGGAEGGGNPVIGLVALLRERAVPPGSAESDAAWIHRGLTSQDVLDTALMLTVGEVLDVLADELRRQIEAVSGLADAHRATVQIGRTLTQHAVPTTFGAVAASWLDGLVDAADEVVRVRGALPAQIGGAAGTLAASAELARWRAVPDPAAAAVALADAAADALGLARSTPWHTRRTPVTRVGDALVTATDAWGRIAADVATGCRPEIAELAEPAAEGRGGSSTMPQKQNPVLSVLIRRAALAAPPLAATLHTAAAFAVDQRPDGAWHAEWDTLRVLARRTAVAADQATELLAGLRVDAARMQANLNAAGAGAYAERDAMRRLASPTETPAMTAPTPAEAVPTVAPSAHSYLGAADLIIDAALARARTLLETSERSGA